MLFSLMRRAELKAIVDAVAPEALELKAIDEQIKNHLVESGAKMGTFKGRSLLARSDDTAHPRPEAAQGRAAPVGGAVHQGQHHRELAVRIGKEVGRGGEWLRLLPFFLSLPLDIVG